MSSERVQVTINVDADLLAEVGGPEDLSEFVNAALRRVQELRERPEELSRLATKLPPGMHPTASQAGTNPEKTSPAGIQAELQRAAAERAAEAAAEQAEITKWDQYLA